MVGRGKQNLAGGGTPNTSGKDNGKAAVEGDVELYFEEWPADSTVEILNHWFGSVIRLEQEPVPVLEHGQRG